MNYIAYKAQLADNLRNLRKMNGLSQQDIANKVLKTINAVSNWELGNTSPPIDDVMFLCDFYDITPNQMLGVDPIPGLEDYKEQADILAKKLELLEQQTKELENERKKLQKEIESLKVRPTRQNVIRKRK